MNLHQIKHKLISSISHKYIWSSATTQTSKKLTKKVPRLFSSANQFFIKFKHKYIFNDKHRSILYNLKHKFICFNLHQSNNTQIKIKTFPDLFNLQLLVIIIFSASTDHHLHSSQIIIIVIIIFSDHQPRKPNRIPISLS